MRETSPYRFPPNERAERTTLLGQIKYVKAEAHEMLQALLDGEGDDRVIEECWDTIQASEGVLRKFPLFKVLRGWALVKVKSLKRGDYGAAR